MLIRIGNPPERGVTYRWRVGVYAILPRDGDLLVTFQDPPDNELQLPGGGVDPGEPLLRALHREVMEETGWKISSIRKCGFYRRFVYMPEYDLWAEKICHIYFARPVLQLGPPTEAGHTAVWTSPDIALDLVASDGDRLFLSKAV